jgi:hypothetical protein
MTAGGYLSCKWKGEGWHLMIDWKVLTPMEECIIMAGDEAPLPALVGPWQLAYVLLLPNPGDTGRAPQATLYMSQTQPRRIT